MLSQTKFHIYFTYQKQNTLIRRYRIANLRKWIKHYSMTLDYCIKMLTYLINHDMLFNLCQSLSNDHESTLISQTKYTLFLKLMIHGSTFVEQQMCPTDVNSVSCIVKCWNMPLNMLKGIWMLLNRIELKTARVYSFQQVAACWTTSTDRFLVWCHAAWWKGPTWRLELRLHFNGALRMC